MYRGSRVRTTLQWCSWRRSCLYVSATSFTVLVNVTLMGTRPRLRNLLPQDLQSVVLPERFPYQSGAGHVAEEIESNAWYWRRLHILPSVCFVAPSPVRVECAWDEGDRRTLRDQCNSLLASPCQLSSAASPSSYHGMMMTTDTCSVGAGC